ncbi:MAG: 2-oxoacid:acceptor oxidoreductase family protein [bacterium]
MKTEKTTNIRIAGLGGMGIIKSAQVLAEVLFRAGYDVKKAEVHGMSQRGGSVTSDIRFGKEVLSPMIPNAETDFLLILAPEELENHRPALRPAGILINAQSFDNVTLPNKKSLNIAMLGTLSRHLDIPVESWQKTIYDIFPEKLHAINLASFEAGRHLDK